MSGTSMDGIDVALLRTDGERVVERGPFLGLAYDAPFRERLKQALEDAKGLASREQRIGCLAGVERELTLRHVIAVTEFLTKNRLSRDNIDVIGFHGQTVLHRPGQGLTVQLGDGPLLACETGIQTVHDMRANDMRHGGQGAPLIPAYHAALADGVRKPGEAICFVNIGGISNITAILPDGTIRAFDSGPGNTLIDQWVEGEAGIPFDAGGAIASEGRVIGDLVARYLDHPFFSGDQRRSLDRNDFRPPAPGEVELADGARSLAHVAAAAILTSAGHLPEFPASFVISGGGRLNAVIMKDLADLAALRGSAVLSAEQAGLDGDAMEAEAWAYLAVRSLKGLPLTFPGTTGVREAVSGGVLAAAVD
nr:anhydro-N-acetylmuramic acid kinase [uncultured Gellertiella sp.]